MIDRRACVRQEQDEKENSLVAACIAAFSLHMFIHIESTEIGMPLTSTYGISRYVVTSFLLNSVSLIRSKYTEDGE